MADIIDEHGNPIQLTDEHGQQVILTDEHGVPMHLTGVATTLHSTHNVTEPEMHSGTHFSSTPTEPVVGVETMPAGGGPVPCHPGSEGEKQQFGRAGSSSSSSSSSEDDGEGGRRKKKGLMQKIKDKLPGHKKKDQQEQVPEKVYTATTKVTVTTPGGPLGEPKTDLVHVEHHEEEHEKKGLMDKIMDKLPGHH